jgi:hypothetical protein
MKSLEEVLKTQSAARQVKARQRGTRRLLVPENNGSCSWGLIKTLLHCRACSDPPGYRPIVRAWATNYVLQSSDTAAISGSWSSANLGVTVNNGTMTATVSGSGQARYYRLLQQ